MMKFSLSRESMVNRTFRKMTPIDYPLLAIMKAQMFQQNYEETKGTTLSGLGVEKKTSYTTLSLICLAIQLTAESLIKNSLSIAVTSFIYFLVSI